MCVVHNPIGRADVGPQRARVARDRVGSPQNAVQRALLLPPRGARRTSTGCMWRSRGAGGKLSDARCRMFFGVAVAQTRAAEDEGRQAEDEGRGQEDQKPEHSKDAHNLRH